MAALKFPMKKSLTILLGAAASFDKVPFEVVGRLQLRHGRGTWNEWFITFADGGVGWLSDAQGSYAITRPRASSIGSISRPRKRS